MPTVIGQPVFYNLKEQKPNTTLIIKGEYCGSTESQKYANNLNHNFFEVDGKRRHVVLSGGQLSYMQRQGTLQVGKLYDVVFKGKKKLEGGAFAGSEANDFEVLEYSKKEMAELIEGGAELRNEVVEAPVVAPVVDARQSDANEDLGSLA